MGQCYMPLFHETQMAYHNVVSKTFIMNMVKRNSYLTPRRRREVNTLIMNMAWRNLYLCGMTGIT